MISSSATSGPAPGTTSANLMAAEATLAGGGYARGERWVRHQQPVPPWLSVTPHRDHSVRHERRRPSGRAPDAPSPPRRPRLRSSLGYVRHASEPVGPPRRGGDLRRLHGSARSSQHPATHRDGSPHVPPRSPVHERFEHRLGNRSGVPASGASPGRNMHFIESGTRTSQPSSVDRKNRDSCSFGGDSGVWVVI